MSLKAVELQFALHKNEEVGVKQQQLTQKPLSDQASLSEAAAKQVVEERHKSTKTEESAAHPSRITVNVLRSGGHPEPRSERPKPKNRRKRRSPAMIIRLKGIISIYRFDIKL